jgi:hypothetical protein
MGGASGGPGRREGDGVGCIVIDMALCVEFLLGRPEPLPSFFINTIILLEHRTGPCRSWTSYVGCIGFFPGPLLLVVVHFVHSLPFTRFFWVRTARLVNYPASFEGLVLIEVCGMDIHIPPPLGFFALWLLQKGVQANRSITTT